MIYYSILDFIRKSHDKNKGYCVQSKIKYIFLWYTDTYLKQGPSLAVTRVMINNCLTELIY